jgi:hypothetical protein
VSDLDWPGLYPTLLKGPLRGLRCYTDRLSNAIANTTVDPLAAREWLASGSMPVEHLNVVLHETAHFSAFNTPVGLAMAALTASHTLSPASFLMDQAAAAGPSQGAILTAILDPYLTPLAEGLAVFAEFDVLPGSSAVISTVCSASAVLAGRGRLLEEARAGRVCSISDAVALALRESRISHDTLVRKEELYRRPLDLTDGYLLGYLWIKALWLILKSRCAAFSDTDFFLSFVTDYFFYDFKLASLLSVTMLDGLTSGQMEIYSKAIGAYIFGERLDDLVSDVQKHAAEWERYALGQQPGASAALGARGNHPKYRNFDPDRAKRIQAAASVGRHRTMMLGWPDYMAGRHILRLFGCPAKVEVEADGRFRVRTVPEGRVLAGSSSYRETVAPPQDGSANGTVEALLLTSEGRVVLAAFVGNELLATMDAATGGTNPKAADACDGMASYLAVEAAAMHISREAALSPGSPAASLHDACREAARQIAWDCYTRTALSADDGSLASTSLLAVMAEGGLVAALGGAESAWLARLSLSCGGGFATAATAAGHWEVDEGTIRHWLGRLDDECFALTGKRPWIRKGDTFSYAQF